MANNFHPCPFCGGKAELIIIPSVDGAENAGGSYVGCPSCGASSSVVFGEKQGLEERWNRRAARAPEQGGEMREAIAFMKGAKWWEYHSTKGTMWQSDQALVAEEAARRYGYKLTHDDMARALLTRESSEPILEEHDRWIDTDAIPPKPAEKRGPEVDALLWMAEHLMGSSVAMTMRGWLAEYRATGKLVVRDADGTVKDSLTVASKERQ